MRSGVFAPALIFSLFVFISCTDDAASVATADYSRVEQTFRSADDDNDSIALHFIGGGEPGAAGAAIAMDAEGRPQVVARVSRFLAAYIVTGEEDLQERIAFINAWDPRLAFDSDGARHIAFFVREQTDDRYVTYATEATGQWTFERVDATPTDSDQLAFALDPDGTPHLVYVLWAYPPHYVALRYATKDAAGWHTVTVEEGPVDEVCFGGPSVAVDPAGAVHIVYYRAIPDHHLATAWHASNLSGVWSVSPLDLDPAGPVPESEIDMRNTSLVIDATGVMHLLYKRDGDLIYATNRTGEWQNEAAFDNYDHADYPLRVDANGAAHTCYLNYPSYTLTYATNAGGEWTSESVETRERFRTQVDCALDADGRPHIVTSDYMDQTLRYAWRDEAGWHTRELGEAPGLIGIGPMAMDSQGRHHMVTTVYDYYDLYRLRFTPDQLDIVPIPIEAGYIYPADIVVDNHGQFHYLYDHLYTYYHYHVYYVTGRPGRWIINVVDDSEDVRGERSLAVDSARHAHVAYVSLSPREIRYATNASGEWQRENLEAVTFGGVVFPDVAVDSIDRAYVAYPVLVDDDTAGLRLMRREGDTWQAELVRSSDVSGAFVLLRLDAQDHVHLVYVTFNEDDTINLEHSTNATGEWTHEIIDTHGPGWISEADGVLDEQDRWHVAYQKAPDNSSSALHYASNVTGEWTRALIDGAGKTGTHITTALGPDDMVHVTYSSDGWAWYDDATDLWLAVFPPGYQGN